MVFETSTPSTSIVVHYQAASRVQRDRLTLVSSAWDNVLTISSRARSSTSSGARTTLRRPTSASVVHSGYVNFVVDEGDAVGVDSEPAYTDGDVNRVNQLLAQPSVRYLRSTAGNPSFGPSMIGQGTGPTLSFGPRPSVMIGTPLTSRSMMTMSANTLVVGLPPPLPPPLSRAGQRRRALPPARRAECEQARQGRRYRESELFVS